MVFLTVSASQFPPNPQIPLLKSRCKGSVSFSYNDCSQFLNDGIDTHPIRIPSSCCSCCTNSTYKVPINPTHLYGLRQSTLIQWSPSRRYYYRFPICDVDQKSTYGNSCSFKERDFRARGRGRWRLECLAWEESRRKPSLCEIDDEAEVILSLLTEISEEGFGVRDRNGGGSSRLGQVESRGNSGKNPNVGSGFSKSNFESVKIRSKEDVRKGSSRLGQVETRGNSGKNKNVGSGFSESNLRNDFESVKIRSKDDDYRRKEENSTRVENLRLRKGGSSSSSYYSCSSLGEFDNDSEVQVKNEKFVGDSSSGYNKGLKQNRIFVEELKDHGDVEHEHEDTAEVSYGLSSGLVSDWRKKSEKKLSEISKESSQKHSRLYEVNESDYRKTNESHKQSFDKGEKSTYRVNIDEGTKRRNNAATQNVVGESDSRMKYKKFAEIPETRISEVETTSGSQKQFRKEEVHLGATSSLVQEKTNMHHKTDQRQKSQQLDEVSEVQEIDLRGSSTSQRRSETRASSVQGAKERKTESKEKTEVSDYQDTIIANTSTSTRKTNTRLKKQEENSDLVVGSGSEVRQEQFQTGQKAVRKRESSRKTENIDDVSVVRSTGVERVSDIQIALEKRISSQERYLTSLTTSVGETRESHRLIDERGSQVGSLHRKPQDEVITMAPSSQLVERDRQNVTSTSGIAIQETGSGFSERIETYGRPIPITFHEDALVSAEKMQKSSVHHVGEFVEKTKHELSISEVQIGTKSSETITEGKTHQSKGSFRGTKGPSDEIWDVTNPSLQESTETEVTPSTVAAENAVTKRSGRSLWNVIGDIVQLRWGRSESHNSTAKSGGRSSSHKSVSSETWFSGHDQDEYYNENVNDPRNDQENPESAEGSGSRSRKDKMGHEMPSSKRLSSASEEEKSLQDTVSGAVTAESSLIEEISGDSQIGASSSGLSELKRRKFQRIDQVPKDRYDEWEEAFKLQSEQRKIDEMFMREALLVAKKAADSWEVPVGAVLVQHGKIIARGWNLVEELRDSTAHAEMICIREASNQLRTWRLSDTTLYVTLEPCPMCAGAILQARINTVVWGAPNKLLGADGSWIRLFPSDGGEGGNDLNMSDKPPAPVHPFHPKMTIRRGVMAAECADTMQQFFQLRRKKKTESKPTSPPSPPPPSCLPISHHHPSKFLSRMHDAFHIMFCL